MEQLSLGVRIADRALFESYLPGPNREAWQHLHELAHSGQGGFAWVWGAASSGKSHLLQAVCAAVPGSAYLPLGQLAPLGSAAVDGTELLPAACIDDVELVVGDERWERALFRVYCEMQARGTALVVAAQQPPPALPWGLADLASRFAAGPVFQLLDLDEAEQRLALQLRARQRGLALPEETARYLQRRFPRDMRTLYELLDTLDAAALSAQRQLTIPFIREALATRN